jgi:hypothetical protein
MFIQYWFPYGLVEMREFKVVAGKICDELIAKARIGPTDLTKGVMETAAGVRMWQALRSISDWALYERMTKSAKIIADGIPTFKLTPATILTDEFKLKSLILPSKSNICPKALDRANRALMIHIDQQEENFTDKCKQIDLV